MLGSFNLPNREEFDRVKDLYPLKVKYIDDFPANGDEGIVYIKDGKPYHYTTVTTQERVLYFGATPNYLTGNGPGGSLYFDSSVHIGSTDDGAPDWAALPVGTKLYFSYVDYDPEESTVSDLGLYSEVLENNNGELVTQYSTLTLGWIGAYQFWDFSQTQDFLEINDDVELEQFLQNSDKLGRLLYNMSQQKAANLEASVNDLKKGNKVYYGTCNTSSSTSTKVVTCSNFKLEKGATIYVTFTYGNTTSYTYLNVNSTGQKAVSLDNNISNHGYKIQAGQTVCFVYDGTYFRAIRENTATTSYYGMTKLNDTLTSSSTTLAATANSVRQLNNNKENTSNKTQSITESSTSTQFPSAKAVYDFVTKNAEDNNSRDTTNISHFNERTTEGLSEIPSGYENFINYYQGQPYVYLKQSIDTSSTPMYLYPLLKAGDTEGVDPYYFSLSPWIDIGYGYSPSAIGGAIYASTLTSLFDGTVREYFALAGTGVGPGEAYVEKVADCPQSGQMIYYIGGDSYPNAEYMVIESFDGTTITANSGTYTATITGVVTFTNSDEGSLATISNWTELTPVGLITISQYGYARIGEEQYNYVNYDDPTPLLAPSELSEGTVWILDKNLDIDLSHCVADNFLTKELSTEGNDITVDTELSDTSENPVQNKIITKELNKTISSKEAEILTYQAENNCLFVAYYNTIQDAFDETNAVEDGDIAVFINSYVDDYGDEWSYRYITLLADITMNTNIVFTDTVHSDNILDLNGHSLQFQAATLEDGATWITYTGGNHSIWGKHGEETGIYYSTTARDKKESGKIIELQNSAVLTIDGGTYTYVSMKTKTPRLIQGTSDATLYIFNASLGVTSTTQEVGATAYAISSMKRCEIENSIVEAYSIYYECGAITGITTAIINNTLVYCGCDRLSSTGNIWYTGINASNCTISNSNIEVSVETHSTYDDTIWLPNARTIGIQALKLDAYNTKILVSDPRYGAGVYGILMNLGGSGTKDYYISNCHIEVDGRGDDDTADKVQNVAGFYCYDNGNTGTVNLNIEGGYYKAARDAIAGKANVYINGGVFESSQHGVYFSGDTIVARNSRFINVPYTGICGWNNYPYGALYTGGDSTQKVYLDNCTIEVDPGERAHPFRHGIVNKGNEIYLSNIHFVGKFNQPPEYPSYGHLRCDTGNTIYIGKGVYFKPSEVHGGTIDTSTYTGIEFNDEWLTANEVI